MKSFIIALTGVTSSLFLFTFLTIAVSACKKSTVDTVTPEEYSGWMQTEFSPTNDGLPGEYALTAKICSPGKPQNFSVAVWYFDPTTDPKTAINSIENPGFDEDGEPESAELASDAFDILVNFNEEARDQSNYTREGEMLIYLDPNQLAVMQITDAAGNVSWHTHVTTGEKGYTCFSL